MLVCNKCGAAIGKCQCLGLNAEPASKVIEMQPEADAMDPGEALETEGLLEGLVGREAARTGVLRGPSLPEMGGGALPTRHLCVGCGEYLATLISMEETGPWVSLCRKCFQDLKQAASRQAVSPAFFPAPAAALSDARLRELASQPPPSPIPAPARSDPAEEVLSDPEILELARAAGIDAATLKKLAAMGPEEIERALNGGR